MRNSLPSRAFWRTPSTELNPVSGRYGFCNEALWLPALYRSLLADCDQGNWEITTVKRARALQVSLQQFALLLAFHEGHVFANAASLLHLFQLQLWHSRGRIVEPFS